MSPAVAGADEPKTFVSVGVSSYQTSTSLNATGQRVPAFCNFIESSEGIFVAHTMSTRDAWYADTSYNALQCATNATRGLADFEIGEQHGISGAAHPNQWAIKTSVIVPTGYPIDANLRLGYGRPGATAGMFYLGSWKAGAHHFGFVTGGAAVKVYTSYPAPSISTSLTAGLNVTPGVLVMASYFGSTAIGAGGQLNDLGSNPISSTRYDGYQYTEAVTLSLARNVGLNLNVWNLIGGSNVGVGTQVGAGLWIRF